MTAEELDEWMEASIAADLIEFLWFKCIDEFEGDRNGN